MDLAFADCVLNTTSRQLIRGGLAVPLEPKMYQLLEVLIQRRPAVVTSIELDEILWPNVYVARTSLTRLVSELRTVLGDSPRDSQIIRTAYKTGYAFAAHVSSAAWANAQPAAAVALLWNQRALPLAEGENIAGRGTECSVLVDAQTVSRRHARITVVLGMATLEDLRSTNGTFVNGASVSAPKQLNDGDEVRLGSAVLKFKLSDPSALTVVTADSAGKAKVPDDQSGIKRDPNPPQS